MKTVRRGRTKEVACSVTLNLFPAGGHAEESAISFTLRGTICTLQRLKEFAESDPIGLGWAIAEGLQDHDVVKMLYPPESKRVFNCQKSDLAKEIKRNVRWFYAVLREFRSRGMKLSELPDEIQKWVHNMRKKGFEDIDPLGDPEGFTYLTFQEVYFDEARERGLVVFEEDERPDSFSRYLFDDSMITPKRLRGSLLKDRTPEEIMNIAPFRKFIASRLPPY